MNKRWAYLYTECTKCHKTDKSHKGNGLCITCYYRNYKRPNPPKRRPKHKDNLQAFIHDLPSLLREVGAIGYSASYTDGTVTLKKLGSKLSTTWTTGA